MAKSRMRQSIQPPSCCLLFQEMMRLDVGILPWHNPLAG